jgi:uncharacterized protein (TIRG00374 family)
MLLAILGLYWLALREISMSQLLSALGQMRLSAVAILFGLNLIIIWSMGIRWDIILRRMGYALAWYWLWLYRMGANAVSYLTPGPHFGGEPLQMHLLMRRHQIPKEIAITSVAVDRFIELLANFIVLMLFGIYLLELLMEEASHLVYSAAAFISVASIMLFLLIALARRQTPISSSLAWLFKRCQIHPRLSDGIVSIRNLEGTAHRILDQPPAILLMYMVSALIQWIFIIGEFWFIYHMAGVSLDIFQLVYLLGAARLTFLLPLPGAMGALEASQMMVLGGLNLSPFLGLSACLVMRLRDLAVVGIGTLLAIHWFACGQKPSPQSIPINGDG